MFGFLPLYHLMQLCLWIFTIFLNLGLMKCLNFCKDFGIWLWQRLEACFETSYGETNTSILQKINLTVSSSKQSFELKMSSHVFENKNMKWEPFETNLMACKLLSHLSKDLEP